MAVLLGLMADLERVKYAVLVACSLLAWPAAGAAPVEESKGVEVRQLPVVVPETASARTPGAAEAAEEDGDAGSELGTIYYDFQLMQDEVRRLHGVVEELNHRIARLEREQRERYIELDQRLVEVRSGEGVAPGTGETDPGTVVDPGVVAPTTERDAYNVAIAIVNAARSSPESEREAEYQRALGLFREIIKNYPNGEFTPNAFYWIGELHLAMDDHEDARQAFAQVVLLYEDHPKVPDALYKLGEVYHRLGDDERARFYLERVIGDYPSSTSAGLARSYLSEIP